MHTVKNVGKPYAGKPHVRFDEKGLVAPALYSTPFIRNELSVAKLELIPHDLAVITMDENSACASYVFLR